MPIRIRISRLQNPKRASLGLLFAAFFHFSSSAQAVPDSLPNLDSLGFEQMSALANQLWEAAQAAERRAAGQWKEANAAATAADSLWSASKSDSTAGKAQRDSLFQARKTAVSAMVEAEKDWKKWVAITAAAATAANSSDSLFVRKSLPKIWQNMRRAEGKDMPEAKNKKKNKQKAPKPAPPAAPKPSATAPPAKKFAGYDPAADVMLRPPTPPCEIARDARDEFSGEIARETAKAELFRHSPPALQHYLRGKTHVVCEAALSRAGATTALLLYFQINDPNARRAFGRIEQNGFAVLKFMDGSTFTLQNAIADEGLFNPETESAAYKAKYPLPPDALKKLRSKELDKIRIAWSRGFEDYDVQQVDLLMRQAACLFQK